MKGGTVADEHCPYSVFTYEEEASCRVCMPIVSAPGSRMQLVGKAATRNVVVQEVIFTLVTQ